MARDRQRGAAGTGGGDLSRPGAGEAEPVTRPDELAPRARTWPELAAVATRCVACPELAAARTQVVVGTWPPGARALLVGEAPGAREDETGVPFVGRAGGLLDELLADAGLPRERVAVANVLKCRPPGNRKPTREEIARCTPWLARQIALVDPLVVGVLGGTAAAWALGRQVRIAEARGRVLELAVSDGGTGRPLVVTYHPAAAARFGRYGGPMAALREDLRLVAELTAR
ncbi:MAG: uracil-DNA glycosylase [Streptosporangiales bacterium]|nr:uracil-DNA glycosylase [Streptosporangiales bacterium]